MDCHQIISVEILWLLPPERTVRSEKMKFGPAWSIVRNRNEGDEGCLL
jgi:hypothetical protein